MTSIVKPAFGTSKRQAPSTRETPKSSKLQIVPLVRGFSKLAFSLRQLNIRWRKEKTW
jgi:hypothetical protein